jgi:hypothetical protein
LQLFGQLLELIGLLCFLGLLFLKLFGHLLELFLFLQQVILEFASFLLRFLLLGFKEILKLHGLLLVGLEVSLGLCEFVLEFFFLVGFHCRLIIGHKYFLDFSGPLGSRYLGTSAKEEASW